RSERGRWPSTRKPTTFISSPPSSSPRRRVKGDAASSLTRSWSWKAASKREQALVPYSKTVASRVRGPNPCMCPFTHFPRKIRGFCIGPGSIWPPYFHVAGVHVRTSVFDSDGPVLPWAETPAEEDLQAVSRDQRTDRSPYASAGHLGRSTDAQPEVAWLDKLTLSGTAGPGLRRLSWVKA